MASSLVIPPALRKMLLPRRSIPGSAIAPTEVLARKTLHSIATKYQQPKNGYGAKTNAAIFEAGLKTDKEPELTSLRSAAHALLLELSLDSVRAADIDVLAAAGRMVATRDVSLVPAIAFARGAEDALRFAVRESLFELGAAPGGYMNAVFVIEAKKCSVWFDASWKLLRHAICATPDDEYARLRDIGRALRDDLDAPRKARVAYAFPDEPWGTEDLQSSGIDYLVSATTSADAVSAHAGKAGRFCISTYALDLAAALPEDRALPIFEDALAALLVKTGREPIAKTPPREVARAIACYRSKEAAAILAPYATNAILGSLVLQYFADAPELGLALEAEAKGRGKLRETVDRVLGKKSGREDNAPVADGAAIPTVLRERSWRAPKNAERTEAILELHRLDSDIGPVLIASPPGPFVPYGNAPLREMTASEIEVWRARVNAGEYAHADYEHRAVATPANTYEYLRVPDAESIWAWNQGKAILAGGPLLLVARHGLKVLPGFFARKWIDWLSWEGGTDMLEAALSFVVPAMAPAIARVAARRKRCRRVALSWLLEHAEVAALGLIPDALGVSGEARSDAESALVYLAQRGEGDAVRRVAKRYGEPASFAIGALLARDPLAIGARPLLKPPSFLRPSELPKARLTSGHALSDEAQAALLEMLQIASVEVPYPGVAVVRDACDAASLGDVAHELTEQWVIGGAPGRHEWMLFSTVHFQSDRGTRRVASLAREWARKDRKKAERACVALANIGTDLALLELSSIAETTRFDALRKLAQDLVGEAADARGLSIDELGDRTVPDLGLDPDGTFEISYGARRFVISLDETLRAFVREKSDGGALGERMTALPRPKKTDDAPAAKEARARFDAFVSDLEAIAKRQLRRLERAMIDDRSWTLADFTTRMAQHPLLAHIARRLVWEATSPGAAPITFRIAEDGTYADERDHPIAMNEGDSVRIAHPARNAAAIMAWPAVFADYAILQPFEQIGRAIATMTPAEATATALERTGGFVANGKKVLGVLESRGWSRDNAGYVTSYTRAVRAADGSPLVARLAISPGIEMEMIADSLDQTTSALVLEATRGERGPIAIGALDPVGFSEIVRDVEALRSR